MKDQHHADELLTGAAIGILLITNLIDWTFQKWFMLVAVIAILIGLYYRSHHHA